MDGDDNEADRAAAGPGFSGCFVCFGCFGRFGDLGPVRLVTAGVPHRGCLACLPVWIDTGKDAWPHDLHERLEHRAPRAHRELNDGVDVIGAHGSDDHLARLSTPRPAVQLGFPATARAEIGESGSSAARDVIPGKITDR